MSHRMLIAGIGNVFLGDDGFGVEVVRRLLTEDVPGWVRVVDFGIRGIQLVQELLDGRYELTVLVDAATHGRAPGSVYLIEPDKSALEELAGAGRDAQTDHPRSVFWTLKRLGSVPGRVLIVGCEPARTEEWFGLSEPVQHAVDEAVRLIRGVIADYTEAHPARRGLSAGASKK
jgi:hydrogenase maturation protease